LLGPIARSVPAGFFLCSEPSNPKFSSLGWGALSHSPTLLSILLRVSEGNVFGYSERGMVDEPLLMINC
jgi:hypothetical protein